MLALGLVGFDVLVSLLLEVRAVRGENYFLSSSPCNAEDFSVPWEWDALAARVWEKMWRRGRGPPCLA